MNRFNDLKTRFRQALILKFVVKFLALVICLWLTASAQAAPGDLDSRFGIGGITPYPGAALFKTRAVALQPDGKIIISGVAAVSEGTPPDNRKIALVRYLPNGTLDTSFGTNGIVMWSSLGNFDIYDLAILPSGKIVAAGSLTRQMQSFPYVVSEDSVIIQFSPEGAPEAAIVSRVGQGLYSSAGKIVVQPDGKYLVAGWSGGGYDGNMVPYKFYLFRFTDSGSPDPTFGTGGLMISEVLSSGNIALQPDGKIIVASTGAPLGVYALILTRLLPDGVVDGSFGIDGMSVYPEAAPTYSISDLTVQPDNKILLASTANTYSDPDFAIWRFNQNGGTPDSSFGTNGKTVTAFSSLYDIPRSILLQPDGKIIVVGVTYNNQSLSDYRPAIARYNQNGSLDAAFGAGGIVTAPLGFNIADGKLQPDGKIVTVAESVRILRFLGGALSATRTANFDFDGDGWADFAVTRNIDANLNWFAVSNPAGALIVETEWGLLNDKIVPADYDGDRQTDVAVFRPSAGDWYILKSADNSIAAVHFGQTGDIPTPADYDGDARADLAVYRQGVWYILNSSNDSFRAEQFGIATDKPVVGDFDGDGKTDLAVYRDGTWYAQRSQQGFFAAQFGLADDIPVASDYDGDAKTDLAVYRPSNGTWYLQNTAEGFKAFQFGIPTDRPVPADYNADGKTNLAVYRAGIWYIRRETGDLQTVYFGYPTDRPVQTAFQP